MTVRRLPDYERDDRIALLEDGKEWERELTALFRGGAANRWLNQALGRVIALEPAEAEVLKVPVI